MTADCVDALRPVMGDPAIKVQDGVARVGTLVQTPMFGGKKGKVVALDFKYRCVGLLAEKAYRPIFRAVSGLLKHATRNHKNV